MKEKISHSKTPFFQRKGIKRLMKLMLVMFILCIAGVGAVFGINAYVKGFSSSRIYDTESISEFENADCIIVLGCKVNGESPSPMLRDRLIRGIELYKAGAAPKIIMSGDHGRTDYDEVNAMKQFAIDRGVPSEDVFMDHAGFSTYESMYRARDVFKAQKVLIVTQKYHLYRAVYIARQLGIEAYGLDREELKYPITNNIREAAARVKDFFYCIAEPEPTYLGEEIPIKTASASLTNDKIKV